MNSEIKKTLNSIEKQTENQSPDQVYVIELESYDLKEIPLIVKQKLEQFSAIQMLTINNCNLSSLKNFPNCTSLIRLDLVNNKIKGEELAFLRNIRHLQTLYLQKNLISTTQDLNNLQHMKKIFQLSLASNPIEKQDNYKQQVFQILPSLELLDGVNINNQFYDKPELKESVKRVGNLIVGNQILQSKVQFNQNLFSANSQKDNGTGLPAINIQKKKISKLNKIKKKSILNTLKKDSAKSKTNLNSKNFTINTSKVGFQKSRRRKSKSNKSGLVFPVGRILRSMKNSKLFERQSASSGVYLTSVLEYLSVEILDLAGSITLENKRKIIQPKDINSSIKTDLELSKLFNDLIIREGGFDYKRI